jgi:hypothetical protein
VAWFVFAYGLIWLVAAITLGLRTPAPDWQAFYAMGRAVLDGTAWYATPAGASRNLAPPLAAPMFGALALLPIRLALLLWTSVGLAAAVWAASRIARTWHRPTWTVIALLLACHGLAVGVILGQVHLLIFVLVTAAWLADREDRFVAAGFWLGAAIYLKPFFALVAAYWVWRHAWRAVGTAALVAGIGHAIGLIWLRTPTVDWLDALRSVTWQYATLNLSVWGWVARADLSVWVAVGLVTLVLVLLTMRLPMLTRDGAWFAALAAAYLVSPIAWLYYALPLIGPLGLVYQQGEQRTRRLLEVGYVGLCVPLLFQNPAIENGRLSAAALGSLYFWALALLWVAGLRRMGTQIPRPHDERDWGEVAGARRGSIGRRTLHRVDHDDVDRRGR